MRRALLAVAAIAAAIGLGRLAAPHLAALVAPPLEFRALERPGGYRLLARGGLSGGVDPLAGIAAAAPPAAEGGDLCAALYADPATPVFGRQGPRVVSFSDYRCPYCRVLTPILAGLAEEGRIRIVHREWPLFGPVSELGARAALAAAEQSGHQALHERMMRSAFVPTRAWLLETAGSLGLDADRLAAALEAPRIDAALGRNAALAARLGLRGTPSLVIGRTIVEGAVTEAELRRLIALEAEAPSPCPEARP